MKSKLDKVGYRIFKGWIVYILITSILLSFKNIHWQIGLTSIINYDLYFLIFLLSIVIYQNTKYNKYIFLNISLWALIYAVSILHIFVGKNYLFGDNYLMYQILPYRKFIISIATCVTIVYISVDYLFYEEKTIKKYFQTMLIVLPINIAFYYKFFIYKYYILKNNNLLELFRCTVETSLLALFFIGLYGYLFYRKEKPISHITNAIVVMFFFFVVYDIVDGLIVYYGMSLPRISYLILTIILLFLIILLLKKIKYTYSEFGKFYESLIFKDRRLDIRVKRLKSIHTSFIRRMGDYLNIFPNRFFFILLMMISSGLFFFFFPEGYGKQIIIAFIGTSSILIIYLNALFKKRNLNNRDNKNFINF